MPDTKTQQAINLYNSGKIKEALKIFKGFKLHIDKEDQRILQIAYEGLVSERSKNFYKNLGIDVDAALEEAKDIIENLYIK